MAVKVSLADLDSGAVDYRLSEAFGPESLGILLVSDLPKEYHDLRRKVLKSAQKLSQLPQHDLQKLEVPNAYYLVGWSRGKEKLASGEFDTQKGSFYVNCSFYNDHEAEGPTEEIAAKHKNLPGYVANNVWPTKEILQDSVEFKTNLKRLCSLMISVALTVASACDRYVSKELNGALPEGYLRKIVKESNTTKARLLTYYPIERIQNEREDQWCGEHLDHSCITALTKDMLLNQDGTEYTQQEQTESKHGLYIKDRLGRAHKTDIPEDCLAFQTGSALEALTKGKFKAVSHYVKGAEIPNVSRSTLAIFCQPSLDDLIEEDCNFAQYSLNILGRHH